ncbi:MAG: hypothetical protein IPN76_27020 [Saprospiraceae bacterium]|nr:hypothetical protein [Saprospiraceae bacterium]
MQNLLRFSQSSWYNNGERPLKLEWLLKHLASCYPDFSSTSMLKENVFNLVFGKEAYNESKLDKLLSEATSLVRKFIVHSCSELASEESNWILQAKFFRERSMSLEFEYAAQQAIKLLDAHHPKDGEYYLDRFFIEAERVKHRVRSNDKKSDINLPNAIQNLDIFYITTKLEYCSYMLVQSRITKINVDESFSLINEVLELSKDKYLHIPIVAVLLCLYADYWRNVKEDAYSHFKKILKENQAYLSMDTLRVFHSYIRSHISRKYNRGDTSCLQELHLLYKEHTEIGSIYQDEGYVTADVVLGAISVALKMGDYEWAIKFLEKHRYLIAGADNPDAIYQFNLANCLFYQGKYLETEDILANYSFKEVYYKLAARRLEIKLLYETSSPLIDSRIDAFKVFVHEQKKLLPQEKIIPNNHFVDMVKHILAVKMLYNSERIQRLLEKLGALPGVAEREWLLEKLDVMKKSKSTVGAKAVDG